MVPAVIDPVPPVPAGPSARPAGINDVLRIAALAASALLPVFFAVPLGATPRGVADWLANRTGPGATAMLVLVALLLLAGEADPLRGRYGDAAWGHDILNRLQSLGSNSGARPGSLAAPVFPGAGRHAGPPGALGRGLPDLAAAPAAHGAPAAGRHRDGDDRFRHPVRPARHRARHPLAAALIVLVREFCVADTLGDDEVRATP